MMLDDDPDSARIYATTRRTANVAASGAGADTDQPVYLIVLHGDFTAVGAPGPTNGPDPTGRMRIVWDPTTKMVTDFGIGPNQPDTAEPGGIPSRPFCLG